MVQTKRTKEKAKAPSPQRARPPSYRIIEKCSPSHCHHNSAATIPNDNTAGIGRLHLIGTLRWEVRHHGPIDSNVIKAQLVEPRQEKCWFDQGGIARCSAWACMHTLHISCALRRGFVSHG
ncbi:conserved hypothetical protein [Histoplasma capsulatum G186AR]|uniref:Uncharacterized protein n=1 Tax=Ajellomyces capsulatus (strain G186AR / H82 / ATCC MYA-2454 / RMSCC 2432) TaxID=447093 RepID=C0P077_AJECG|nr:uncharacterized protein HCBG_08796 [Histoplasma capsulatum G186AR]EEH02893.1 conserved hypothetical protein [Histoplasma capsulatum G186AR]